jgi:transcriptional regulator with XRE-family HTH domain
MAREYRQEIGHRIRRRRMAFGMMQNDLAEKVQMPQAHISRLERGAFEAINPERLTAIARVLHTTTDYLLGLSDDPGPIVEEEEEQEQTTTV